MFARHVIELHDKNFPKYFEKLQKYASDKRYIVTSCHLTSSNKKWLQSLGYNVVHFSPRVRLSKGEWNDMVKSGLMSNEQVFHGREKGKDFHVIYPSEFYIQRLDWAVSVVQNWWRGFQKTEDSKDSNKENSNKENSNKESGIIDEVAKMVASMTLLNLNNFPKDEKLTINDSSEEDAPKIFPQQLINEM